MLGIRPSSSSGRVREDYPGELISVAASVGYTERRIPVERELNYLHPYPPWIPQADGTKRSSDYDAIRQAVTETIGQCSDAAQIHYSESLAALDRMNAIEAPEGWRDPL